MLILRLLLLLVNISALTPVTRGGRLEITLPPTLVFSFDKTRPYQWPTQNKNQCGCGCGCGGWAQLNKIVKRSDIPRATKTLLILPWSWSTHLVLVRASLRYVRVPPRLPLFPQRRLAREGGANVRHHLKMQTQTQNRIRSNSLGAFVHWLFTVLCRAGVCLYFWVKTIVSRHRLPERGAIHAFQQPRSIITAVWGMSHHSRPQSHLVFSSFGHNRREKKAPAVFSCAGHVASTKL